ncbi:hypothetical protein [Tolypothrix sp. PCC 7910]|nr:hypothetical protein [Tolypothrix sp. PCC 7910]
MDRQKAESITLSQSVFSQRKRLRQGKFAQVGEPTHATFRKI